MEEQKIHEDFLNLEEDILSSIGLMISKINNIIISDFNEDIKNFKRLNEELIGLKEIILTANEPYGLENCSRKIKGVFYQVTDWIGITVNIISYLEHKGFDKIKEYYGDFV